MHKYRLTKRGKLLVAVLILIVFLSADIINIKISAKTNSNDTARKNVLTENLQPLSINNVNITNHTKPDASLAIQKSDLAVEPVKDNGAELYKTASEDKYLSINAEQAYSHDGKKLAFLTFDDGPSKNVTPKVLDILDKYNIKATFFVLGALCDDNSDILKDVEKDGHSIGIHTYSHNYKIVYSSVGSFLNEINETSNTLKRILGADFHTRLFRFPGGSFGDSKEQFRMALEKQGYVYVDWNALSRDGESSDISPQKLLENLEETVKSRDHIVILMHDSSSKSTTVQALPSVIEYLKKQGYKFARLK